VPRREAKPCPTPARLDAGRRAPRLFLKVPSLNEFEPWCAYMADEESAQFIGKVQPPSVVWRSICSIIGSWQAVGFGFFSVFEKSTGRWVGRLLGHGAAWLARQ